MPEFTARSRRGENTAAESAPAPETQPQSEPGGHKKSRCSALSVLAGIAVVVLLVVGAAINFTGGDASYIASLDFEQASIGLFVGEEQNVQPQVTAFGSNELLLTWSSSDPSVASVDESGAVSALAPGESCITVTEAASGRQAQYTVCVYGVDEMMLSFTEATLGEGERLELSVQTGTQGAAACDFSSSDPAVASVDESGCITAIQPGTVTITASARGYEDGCCTVTVRPAPTAMDATVSGKMCLGESRQLVVSMSDAEFSSDMEYSSDDPSVVTVDSSGKMTAASKGTATVTVRAHNGVSCSLPVTVGGEPASVTAEKKKTVYSGRPVRIEMSDSTGCCEEYYFTSSDPEVLQVDENGCLHALKRGSATVTCTSYNGKTAECRVTTKIVDYQNPYSSQIVFDNIAALQASYPDIITTQSIGTSVQGRDITLLTLGTGERKVLIVAGMHSKESIAVTFTMRCIEEYAQAMTDGKMLGRYNVKKLLSEYTLYFVPLLNPDGMDIALGLEQPEYTDQPLTEDDLSDYKNNANGVNLNRNFPFEWGHDGVNTTTPDARSYAGASAGSEPETQAIISLCSQHEFEWMFNMHCKGHMVFYQDEVNETTQRSMNIAARLAGRCDFVLNNESTPYEISGGLENWFRWEYKNPGLCVEMVESKYSIAVNGYFEKKVQWDITKGLFLMCLGQ